MGHLPRETDVVVVGGGPAGLAAALAARRAGLDVLVADRARPPIDKACGEGLMPDGVAALRQLGIDAQDLPGLPFRGIRFVDRDLRAEARFSGTQGLGIRRPDLHQALADRARDLGIATAWHSVVEGVTPTGIRIGGTLVRCRWIIGADGVESKVREWAGLERIWSSRRRIGLRQRFRVSPWTDFVEVHWGAHCQAYVTPVAVDEVCVTIVGRTPNARLSELQAQFPSLASRLRHAEPISPLRGAPTMSSKLRTVANGRVALIGDASGSVDAVTGEGLSLAFQQATALGSALAAADLRAYDARHRRLARRPRLMAHVLLAFDGRERLRRWALARLTASPRMFERLLAFHIGGPPRGPAGLEAAPGAYGGS